MLVPVVRVWMVGAGLAEALGAIEHNGTKVDLVTQRIGKDQIEVVTHILVRMIQIGAVDNGDPLIHRSGSGMWGSYERMALFLAKKKGRAICILYKKKGSKKGSVRAY